MIIFDLTCSADHRFEGWFRSADDFGQQDAQGMVNCPYCGSHEVRRLPSAVHVASSAASDPQPADGQKAAAADPLAVAKAFIEDMIRHSDDVGTAFADEARRMHYHESPERPIRGVASADDCAALQEEGINVLRLPRPKKPEELN
ncbi:MAG: DUF1178 family protein [Rhodocyclales bacterium]|nr:DUF1178 family protein [Rhodocyclales bacterium]